MSLLWIILLLIAALVAIVLTLALRRPDHFRVSRSREIAATSAQLYPLINELRRMNTWNPYVLRDPASVLTYEGPDQGPGARCRFAGRKSGTGFIEITDVVPDKAVSMRLVMTKPFNADNTVEFTLEPVATGTRVTWAMGGRQPLMAKVMATLIDCDRMIGRDFDQGLAGLERAVLVLR